MTEIPKYNFKKIEDLLSNSSHISKNKKNEIRTNTQTSFRSYKNSNTLNSLRKNTIKKKNKRNISQFSTRNLNTTSTSINDYTQKSFPEQIKTMENLINIVKENAYDKNKQEILDKTLKKNKLKNNVNILETYLKLNRISKNNFKNLSKGIKNENERLMNLSERANRESHFFSLLMPNFKKEIEEMKKEIEIRKEETKNLNNEKMLIQKELNHLYDEIKKLNYLNTETFNQKEKIKNTLDLFQNHIVKQKNKVNLQNIKTNELIGSLSYLAKKSKVENEYY
jgi:hypothetical protein